MYSKGNRRMYTHARTRTYTRVCIYVYIHYKLRIKLNKHISHAVSLCSKGYNTIELI